MKLICYLSMGYPTLKKSIELADEYVRSGCDVIELDFPAKNPYLENDLIASRMEAALRNTSDYRDYMETIVTIKANHPKIQIIVLIYEESIREIGQEAFTDFCKTNAILDVIYIGSKHPKMRASLIESGIRISSFVPFNLDDEAINIAQNTNGFVYMQAKTETDYHPEYPRLKDCIRYLKDEKNIDRPIYAGVGIRNENDVAMAKEAGADGVFVGSTVLRLHDDLPKLRETIRSLKSKT